MVDQTKYGVFNAPCRVWVIAAVHGDADRLATVHKALMPRIEPGDKLVYTGNILGHGPAVRDALNAVLLFRRDFLAIRGNDIGDIALLRGAQEEMWHRLFELQFSINPVEVLEWMLDQGAAATIEAYGGNASDGHNAARQGPIVLTRWTNQLREAVRVTPGHREYMSNLRHAAYTTDGTLLFVSAGIDPARPLDAQEDAIWWGTRSFTGLTEPYFGCKLVVRGYDPGHGGYREGAYTASLDAGCGFGGPLVAACITADGVADMIEG